MVKIDKWKQQVIKNALRELENDHSRMQRQRIERCLAEWRTDTDRETTIIGQPSREAIQEKTFQEILNEIKKRADRMSTLECGDPA
ncbi:hypothetical protein BN873_310015 [Candidatus Competibacter denitrificans Run_A_D11]|uniref:Uncharacterized protein n=1 Tax=Candidatus Competibacter denitrificans Run_A_D11 TaxID=1400863 RepID=W6M3Y4_9GAMM|nr:hypothetical protein [Candidatus Competibacter denitrificans]CDI02496.1 hypothetical protein BN873_310015 [Candidatus Competibacter denitrificans Run_A_D11]HRC70488.1 hypothetical protein [Candidatus Competibacter denitrificans]